MIIPFGFLSKQEGASNIYSDLTVAYSLRELNTWDNAVLKLRRSSDNAVKWIFFDNGTITLSSFVGDDRTTPSATTLATWVSTDDAFVEEWIGQTPDNTVNTSWIASNLTTSQQPTFITAGVINVKNGKPAIRFNGAQNLVGGTIAALDSGNDISTFHVHSPETAGQTSVIATTSISGVNYLALYTSTSTFTRNIILRSASVSYFANDLAQDTSFNQRLYSGIITATTISAYKNNVAQETGLDVTGTSYDNSQFEIGAKNSSTDFNGNLQEIIIYPSDKTALLTDINTDINSYYTIY